MCLCLPGVLVHATRTVRELLPLLQWLALSMAPNSRHAVFRLALGSRGPTIEFDYSNDRLKAERLQVKADVLLGARSIIVRRARIAGKRVPNGTCYAASGSAYVREGTDLVVAALIRASLEEEGSSESGRLRRH